jgi:hypothetical protein
MSGGKGGAGTLMMGRDEVAWLSHIYHLLGEVDGWGYGRTGALPRVPLLVLAAMERTLQPEVGLSQLPQGSHSLCKRPTANRRERGVRNETEHEIGQAIFQFEWHADIVGSARVM